MLTERPRDFGIDASLGLGVALFSTALRGSAASGYRAHDDQLLTAAPILDLRAGYVFNRSLALVVYTSVLTPLRSSSLRFADREAGRYGELVLNIGAGPRITVF